jgi:hypothetical protein
VMAIYYQRSSKKLRTTPEFVFSTLPPDDGGC